MTQRLQGKRILITQADDYMGPAFAAMFRQHGAEVIEDRSDLAVVAEDALLAVFLASDESDFFVGQAIPFSGGWVQ